ncbi:MFS transporter [Aquabacter spiritensis]|uniref:UMF1 family MFS transporter n=1 Tax=Aquabacter spiritensis TaxID=933073 RepID=A0A4R3LU08_9HYPH|nr:MFS transporter [Aquabacter spiritensis]TCT03951.1 UMF1 family MFS transporter [Aquabacter spiritensis]
MVTADSPRAPRRALVAWVLFDPACQPFFTLVTTFIFAPYFVSAVVGDPARGQALWGYATGAAGLFIALCSPLLGAVADAAGQRKPWIAGFGAMLVLGSALLWFAAPGEESRIPLILLAFAIATIGAEFATVFNNAMMPSLVPPSHMGRLSGAGWGCGYAGGLISLAIMLVFFSTSPETGLTLLGTPPALGLDAAAREGDRISGPFTALWFLLFAAPLFFFVPDTPAKLPLRAAMRVGLKEVSGLFGRLRTRRNLARFLIANMVYADGLVALFAFGGIYAAGTFGWGSLEIGIFGILLTIFGTVGALVGGRLDDAFGARAVITGSLAVLFLASLGILGLDRDSLLFGLVPTAPAQGLFATLPEKIYLGLGIFIGSVAGPLQAASRSLLVRLAPAESIAEYFGLFALSGKLTSFAAPTLVAIVTTLSGSQKAGVAVLLVFFALGIMLISGVREPGKDG